MEKKKLYFIKKSNIHGNGVFSYINLKENIILDEVIIFKFGFFPYIVNDIGKTINHCDKKYNTKLVYSKKKNCYLLKTICSIKKNKEILMNYNDTPFYIEKPEQNYKKC